MAAARKFDEAIALTERHVRGTKPEIGFVRMRALLEQHAGRPIQALAWALAAEKIESHPDTMLIAARGEVRAGRTASAVARCRALLGMHPGHLETLIVLAEAHESAVETAEADLVLDEIDRRRVELDPVMLVQMDYLRAAVRVHQAREADAIDLLDRIVAAPAAPDDARMLGYFLRAKACDRLKRYDDAFESATRANAIDARPFDPLQYREAVDELMSNWTRASMRVFPTSASPSEVPVFIAGMPRSGTSLLDQIVDAHAEAAGVGEMEAILHFARQLEGAWDASLPAPDSFGPMRDRAFRNAAQAYLTACSKDAPRAKRIVNKSLGNNRIVGLLARLFPKTRIIHALREPRDVAVSCFMGGFNNAYYPWTTRIDWIAAAWGESRRLMEHWKRESDLPILDVRYEEVVTDPSVQFPRVIDFLGLGWDEGCTRFHESKRTVRTLSYDQVNRPLYTSSVSRWQRYEKYLKQVEWPAYP
ncbi:MAG: hypothetical protein RLY21_2663 [Planctomycetota bacterium]